MLQVQGFCLNETCCSVMEEHLKCFVHKPLTFSHVTINKTVTLQFSLLYPKVLLRMEKLMSGMVNLVEAVTISHRITMCKKY